jgi:hemerythrin-like domain-containing protein
VKRSPELAQLSRDHHVALEAALLLRRAGDENLAAAVERFTEFWRERGERHFEIEEELLLPAVGEEDAEWAGHAARVRREHGEIRTRSAQISGDLAAARELGELLNDHVRFEERTLFPLLEERLSRAALSELGTAIERAEHT